MKFASLSLPPPLIRGLRERGLETLTPIQVEAIPPARRGRDVLAFAPTGTGKTAAYAVPLLLRMLEASASGVTGAPRSLVLVPTRELAEQVARDFSDFARHLDVTVLALYGGVKLAGQAAKLKAGVDILVSTPGRLLEHLKLGNVLLSRVEILVFDEADRMLDMGFLADIEAVWGHVTREHQTLLFSATHSHQVEVMAHRRLRNHVPIQLSRKNAVAETVRHVVYPVDDTLKHALFIHLLRSEQWFQVLAFTSTREQADALYDALSEGGIDAAVCHGDRTQGARRRAIRDFREHRLQVLVATEVAARGLDIEGLDQVVNVYLPWLPEDYVHRVGRAGRAGQPGRAISLVSREESRALAAIEALIGEPIRRVVVKGMQHEDRDRQKAVTLAPPRRRTNKATAIQIQSDKAEGGKKVVTAPQRPRRPAKATPAADKPGARRERAGTPPRPLTGKKPAAKKKARGR